MTTLTHHTALSQTFAPGVPVSGTADLVVGRDAAGHMLVASIGTAGQAWLLLPTDAQGGWAQFDLAWVTPHDRRVPLEPGATFAFVSRQVGLWSVNVCRVVYGIDERTDGGQRFGFAYGTVGNHVVKGEERFVVDRDGDGSVRFSIAKFSRPAHPLVRLAGPISRRLQRRFSVDALARMTRAATP